MNKNNYNIEDSQKLSNLFKEIQDIRYGRVRAIETETPKQKIKFNKVYVVNHKFNAIGAITGILFLILFSTSIHSNYIFATTEAEKTPISEFEENNSQIDILNVISENCSDTTKKEILNREIQDEFEVKYIDNNQLPIGEENVIQEGALGYRDQTVILTYENGDMINENIIDEVIKSEPVEKIIERGTSELLYSLEVHIGDTLYTKEEANIYNYPRAKQEIATIYQYIDVQLLEVNENWVKISVEGLEGYTEASLLTSANIDPDIVEKTRLNKIKLGLNFDMELNMPSGLTRQDFKRALSGNSSDTNKIFENNAELFYEIEGKYNINGIFVAAIGIHESNWGRSAISTQKKNLFGYGAYDSSPMESAYSFESYEYGIDMLAKILTKYYLNENGTLIYDDEIAEGTYFNGPTVSGVNTRYASDPEWCSKVYNTMLRLYGKIVDIDE